MKNLIPEDFKTQIWIVIILTLLLIVVASTMYKSNQLRRNIVQFVNEKLTEDPETTKDIITEVKEDTEKPTPEKIVTEFTKDKNPENKEIV